LKWQALVDSEKKRVAEVRLPLFSSRLLFTPHPQACSFASERGLYMRKLESSLKSTEEEVSRTKREAEKKFKKMSAAVAPASTREETLSQEVDGLWVNDALFLALDNELIPFSLLQKIVKCTTCKQGMREVVLTKCMHSTFDPSYLIPSLTTFSDTRLLDVT
jgi:E3 ubiquitin-protein ligase BRE1